MKDIVADTFRVSFSPGEIAVDFGQRSASASGEEVTIALSDRLMMPPVTAQRLVLALAEALQDHEKRPSPAPAAARPSLESFIDPTRDMLSSRDEPSEAGRNAGHVFGVIASLEVPYVYERSFRMRQGALLPNRFLLSVIRRALGERADEILSDAFGQLGMPGAFREEAERDLSRSQTIHFGFEGDEDSLLFKVYVEIESVLDEMENAEPDASPQPLHVSYKWDPSDLERRVVSRYMLYPPMPISGIGRRLEEMYAGAESARSLQIARDILALAEGRMPERDIQYLEVKEEGNDRRSYDLNLYDAELRLRDLQPMLSRMRRQYSVSPGQFQVLYDQIRGRRFGHLAGGVHRNGRDFFNVYYGAGVIRPST